jgi:hypothetical protein
MKRSLLINIVLALLVLGLGLWFVLKPKEQEKAGPAVSVSGKKAADAKRIAITRKGLPEFVLEKDAGGHWVQTAPFPARVDASKAGRLLDILGATAKTTYPATDLARFELDQPAVRVTVDDQTFAFGSVNAVTDEQYLLAGDRVFLVSPVHGFSLPNQTDSLASHMLLAEDEIPIAFVLPGFKLELKDGKWAATPPPPDPAKISQDDYLRWAENWRMAASLATQVASGKEAGDAVRISLQNGRTLELIVASRTPELRLLRTDENLVYVFPADTANRLLTSVTGGK